MLPVYFDSGLDECGLIRDRKRARFEESGSEESEAAGNNQVSDSPRSLISKTTPRSTLNNDKQSIAKKAIQAQARHAPAETVKSTSPPTTVYSMANTFPPTHAFDIPQFNFQQTAPCQFVQPLTYNPTTKPSQATDVLALRFAWP